MSPILPLLENLQESIKLPKDFKLNSSDFLAEILKTLDEKEAVSLLKELKIDKKEIEKLLSKIDDKNLKKNLEAFLKTEKSHNSPTLKELLQTTQKDIEPNINKKIVNEKDLHHKNNNKDENKTENIKNLLNELEKEIENLIQTLETKKTKEKKTKNQQPHSLLPTFTKEKEIENVKKDIEKSSEIVEKIIIKIEELIPKYEPKFKSEKVISTKTKTPIQKPTHIIHKIIKSKLPTIEFKDVKSIKDIIKIAKEKELNIKEIVIEIKNEIKKEIKKLSSEISPKKNPKKDSQIELDFPKPKFVLTKKTIQPINNNTNTHITNQKSKKISIKTLLEPLNQNALTQQKQTKPKKENSNQAQTNYTSYSHNIVNELKANIAKAKESIKHFANNLKEAVENYKPPMSKITLEMHPKELGKVEVTIVKRGDNLQIQINSNNQAVNFLNSQQQELRQNLVSMGFSQVNMSFNSNQERKEQQQYKQNQKLTEEEDELIIEIPYTYA